MSRTLVEKMLREGKPLVLTFIDYSAAFDSVGHKFLDYALGQAKARSKTRSMFGSILDQIKKSWCFLFLRISENKILKIEIITKTYYDNTYLSRTCKNVY